MSQLETRDDEPSIEVQDQHTVFELLTMGTLLGDGVYLGGDPEYVETVERAATRLVTLSTELDTAIKEIGELRKALEQAIGVALLEIVPPYDTENPFDPQEIIHIEETVGSSDSDASSERVPELAAYLRARQVTEPGEGEPEPDKPGNITS